MKIKLVLSMTDIREFVVESKAELRMVMETMGFRYIGQSESGPRLLLRKELQDQPTFKGLHGPCYDCSDRVSFRDAPDTFVHRYETWEVYDRLST